MLNDSEDAIIESIIKEHGLTEENCLSGLTEQQRQVWVQWAILGKSEQEILESVFRNRKSLSVSMVKYVIGDAQLRILLNVLKDFSLMCDGHITPSVQANIEALVAKVDRLKRQKGARKCRE